MSARMADAGGKEAERDLHRARSALAGGDLRRALQIVDSLVARHPRMHAALHLAGILQRRLGRPSAARRHFLAALEIAPSDPHVLNSFANLLTESGENAAALDCYRMAMKAAPANVEIMVNYALSCKRVGDRDESHRVLNEAVRLNPRYGPAWQALGALLYDRRRIAESARAFGRALELAPTSIPGLKGMARCAWESGGDPAPYLARACALVPDDRSLAVEHALALAGRGDAETAQDILVRQVRAAPLFREAHAALSRIRWEQGDASAFARSYEEALDACPQSRELWRDYASLLLRAGLPSRVLKRLEKTAPAIGADAARIEAAASTEAGELDRADRAFARVSLAGDQALEISYLRHCLRAGRAGAAATYAASMVERKGGHRAWPYLATAWRLLDDARWAWLEGDPALIRVVDLPVSGQELSALAEYLRAKHTSRTHPFDQSVRGGTQTAGNLFDSSEPEIRSLKIHFDKAVRAFLDGLPPPDPGHPLLRHPREAFRFAGAWSIRLSGGGFHVNHVHTTNWISSAFYVTLPGSLGADDKRGWLTLGQPPTDLGLNLEPFRMVQPKTGRLVLFPSTMWHGTCPFDEGERMTVAFDVAPAGDRHAP